MKNEIVIIDERMRKIEKEKLKELGYKLKEIKKSDNVYPEISAHVDIFTCKIGEKLIVEPSKYIQIKNDFQKWYNIEKGVEYIDKKYPYDIIYTDSKIKEELVKQGYELINTTQGYTNCSIAVIDDNSAIVTDKGLYKILLKHKVDVLYLKNELDIKLLNENGYSNIKGFIGGAISRINNNIIISGDLKKIDKDGSIKQFIQQRDLNIIDFSGLDVIDYGGIVILSN